MELRLVAVAATIALTCGCAQSPASRALPGAPVAGSRGAVSAARSNETVLYSFSGYTDGGDPAADLVADSSGTLYGTTVVGGEYGCGTVFNLAPVKKPPWNENVLYGFDCYGTGKNPYGGVAFDAAGNLDGTTVNGGACGSYGCGVVFQLAAGGGETVLHDFAGGDDGSGPGGGVAIDKRGNVYGTTPDGGADGYGVVYGVSRRHGTWRESVIHTFTGGADGSVGSLGRLLIDPSGNLYGVTEEGGTARHGTVFELSRRKGTWNLTTLYTFTGAPDAASPYGGLVADSSGNLYGTTYFGGSINAGAVFELIRHGNGSYRERVLYSFTGSVDGGNPTSTLVFGASGDLYGTTSNGGNSCGSYGCGVVFALDPKGRKESVLHAFGGASDGQHPYYGLLLGKNGVFYGTTAAGGNSNQGVVFEVKP